MKSMVIATFFSEGTKQGALSRAAHNPKGQHAVTLAPPRISPSCPGPGTDLHTHSSLDNGWRNQTEFLKQITIKKKKTKPTTKQFSQQVAEAVYSYKICWVIGINSGVFLSLSLFNLK